MEDPSLLASVLKRMNENQLALGAAIEELSNWVEQRGSTEVAQNIRGHWKRWIETQDSSPWPSPPWRQKDGPRNNYLGIGPA